MGLKSIHPCRSFAVLMVGTVTEEINVTKGKELDVVQLSLLQDNYAYVVCDRKSQTALIVDSPEAEPIIECLRNNKLTPVAILNTHHHWDHIGANTKLKHKYPELKIFGSFYDRSRIPEITDPIDGHQSIVLIDQEIDIIQTPGHTLGHISYFFKSEHFLFPGDTLFSAGCGRLFEGTPEVMLDSLCLLRNLPDDTLIFCAHEYTQSNIGFALSIDSKNTDLVIYASEVEKLRSADKSTIPTVLSVEKKINPFLRFDQPEFVDSLSRKTDLPLDSSKSVLSATRKLKDVF